ncbi:MAG: hypothetical protein LBN98_06315 [Prevotellaceae bacterium]|nr:hypothetical protein [Prevotellaceae bacterium]
MEQIRNLHLRSLPLPAHYAYFTLLSRSPAAHHPVRFRLFTYFLYFCGRIKQQ